MINARALATLGIGFAARQIAAFGLLVDSVVMSVKPDAGAMGGGEPRTMELHKLHILKRRQRDEDVLFMLLS